MNLCPVCNQPVPDNEWVAYHRHEDCADRRSEPTSGHIFGMSPLNELGGRGQGGDRSRKIGNKASQ